jgi:hypothetical protein
VDSNAHKPSFWTTLPGILTGIAAVIGAITGLLAAMGFFHPSPDIPSNIPPVNNDKKITESTINHIPISNAGLDRTVNEDYVVILNGSKSYDPDGDPITYSWRQIGGPSVKLDNATIALPSFTTPTVSADTILVFELTVKDNKGGYSNIANVTIFVKPLSTSTLNGKTTTNSVNVAKSYSFLKQWGSLGTGDGQFNAPRGIAIDSSGYVYVADTANSQIKKFDSTGNFIAKWGSQGTGDGQFSVPAGMAIDSSGNVYVNDGNDRVQKFDSDGTFITKWDFGRGDNPSGIAIDSSNNVYVVDSGNSQIKKFDSTGNFIAKWGSQGTGDGQFSSPEGMAIDSSGNVYVADTENNRIQVFSPS